MTMRTRTLVPTYPVQIDCECLPFYNISYDTDLVLHFNFFLHLFRCHSDCDLMYLTRHESVEQFRTPIRLQPCFCPMLPPFQTGDLGLLLTPTLGCRPAVPISLHFSPSDRRIPRRLFSSGTCTYCKRLKARPRRLRVT
jgi:hypothetical protein